MKFLLTKRRPSWYYLFRFEEPAKKAFVWGFSHGKYGDSWSILHVLSGTLLAVAALYLDLSMAVAYTIIVPLLFAYELSEVIFGVAEDVENAISDVVFGLIGFFAIFSYHYFSPIADRQLPVLAACLSIAALAVLYVGFRSYSAHRKSSEYDAELRAGDTPQSVAAIKRDNILFFGFAVTASPVLALGTVAGLLFLIVGLSLSMFGAQKVSQR